MTDDIVARLRRFSPLDNLFDLHGKAADEIEQLRAENAQIKQVTVEVVNEAREQTAQARADTHRLRTALQPFAAYQTPYIMNEGVSDFGIPANTPHRVGDYRRARAALAPAKEAIDG